ncbi:nucleotidyltransferase family protein [Euzebya sp.]|uniref:nucleotidyltransferase family protein n=1 Tax=Euzebya sp. TaxID=1971409 RepID=UPI0035193577
MTAVESLHTLDEEFASFCRRNGITRLAVFGSALRDELGLDSDLDLLIEFEPGRKPGLLRLAQLEMELEGLVGREVELRTYHDLSVLFRDEVRRQARDLYAAA